MDIDDCADAFGNQEGLRELLESKDSVRRPHIWLRQVHRRCLESEEVSTSLPFLVDPLIRLIDHLSRSGSSQQPLRYGTNLLHVLTEIATDPRRFDAMRQFGGGRVAATKEAVKTALLAKLQTLREVFVRLGSQGEAAAAIAAIAARLGKRFYDDEKLRRELDHCSSVDAARYYALALALTHHKNPMWLKWAQIKATAMRKHRRLSPSESIVAAVCWCVLIGAAALTKSESLELAVIVSGEPKIDCMEVLSFFGQDIQLRAMMSLIRCANDGVSALSLAAELLILGFNPLASIVVEAYSVEGVRYSFSPLENPVPLQSLSSLQVEVLEAIADSTAAFERKTNLWAVWGLPPCRDGLAEVVRNALRVQ